MSELTESAAMKFAAICAFLAASVASARAASVLSHDVVATDDGITCISSTASTTVALQRHTSSVIGLHALPMVPNASGFAIQLIATPQLEQYAGAKAAFARAAATWQKYITNPVTINVAVDFGPTRFGEPYPNPNILGSTSPADQAMPYSFVRSALTAAANYSDEAVLDARLPLSAVTTDIGPSSVVVAAQANLRALRLLGAAPTPGEPTPSIGFNSAFAFDFDRTDGISNGMEDFEAVATHELGHVLGFESEVGAVELAPTRPVAVTPLDLFRVPPTATQSTFDTAVRLQSSGGTHVLLNPYWSSNLSTGRPDGSGGDGRQASHWKDNVHEGFTWGVMDPTLSFGELSFVTVNDLVALDMIGYGINYPHSPAAPTNLSATATSGNVVELQWSDNADNEDDYEVWMYSSEASKWIQLGEIAANRTHATITGRQAGTLYTFAVLASNAGGYSDYSNEASVQTPTSCTGPSVTIQPASQSVPYGGSALLVVEATGTAPLSYQWFEGLHPAGVAIQGATAASFATPPLTATQSLWVRVTNPCETVDSSVATITVTALPLAPPTNLRYVNRTSTTVDVLWTHDGTNVTGFRSYYSLDGAHYTRVNDHPPSWRGVQFTNLSPEYGYFFAISALSATSESAMTTVFVPSFTGGSPRRRSVRH